MTAIDWSSAPEWARWAAQDSNGTWWWYSQKPDRLELAWIPKAINESWTQIERADVRSTQHWMISLTKRP